MAYLEISRTAHEELSGVISSTLVGDPYSAVEELLANSYDADATRVDLSFDSAKGILRVSDNGTGMGAEGLDGFYRMGDSEKALNRVTQRGRRTIGKYGIASVLLRYLADSYVLTTVRDGEQRTVVESFIDGANDGQSLEVLVKQTGAPAGTTIELYGLRHDILEEQMLSRRMKTSLPLGRDFELYLNGSAIEPRSMSGLLPYNLDVEIEGCGPVSMTLYYSPRRMLDETGVFIYVNGRLVGDPNQFHLGRRDEPFFRRMITEVKADGIEHAISFDRSRFQDVPEVASLRSSILRFINRVHNDVASETSRANQTDLKSSRGVQNAVTAAFSAKAFAPAGVRLNYVHRDEDDVLVEESQGQIIVNTGSSLTRRFKGDRSKLEAFVDFAYTATHVAGPIEGKKYARALLAAAEFVQGKTERFVKQDEDVISPLRLYRSSEASYLLGIGPRSSGALFIARPIKRDGGLVLGQDIIDVQRDMDGYLPLNEFAHKVYADVTRQRVQQIVDKAEHDLESRSVLPPFIRDIGIESPFFIVDPSRDDEFVATFTPNRAGSRRFVSLKDLIFELGLPLGDALRTLDSLSSVPFRDVGGRSQYDVERIRELIARV